MTVEERVIDILSDQLGIDKEEVKIDKKLVEELEAGQADLIEIVLWLEEEFGIDIPDDEADKFATVKDIVDYMVEVNKKSGE